jgi:hypothetical protein
VASVLVVLALAACGGSERSGLDAAQQLAARSESFDQPQDAARSFARIADELLAAGKACGSKTKLACEWQLSGAAFAHVMASVAPRCTQAELQPVRAELARYLAERPTTALPPTPAVPTCT